MMACCGAVQCKNGALIEPGGKDINESGVELTEIICGNFIPQFSAVELIKEPGFIVLPLWEEEQIIIDELKKS